MTLPFCRISTSFWPSATRKEYVPGFNCVWPHGDRLAGGICCGIHTARECGPREKHELAKAGKLNCSNAHFVCGSCGKCPEKIGPAARPPGERHARSRLQTYAQTSSVIRRANRPAGSRSVQIHFPHEVLSAVPEWSGNNFLKALLYPALAGPATDCGPGRQAARPVVLAANFSSFTQLTALSGRSWRMPAHVAQVQLSKGSHLAQVLLLPFLHTHARPSVAICQRRLPCYSRRETTADDSLPTETCAAAPLAP